MRILGIFILKIRDFSNEAGKIHKILGKTPKPLYFSRICFEFRKQKQLTTEKANQT
jgi:hypothetical protein